MSKPGDRIHRDRLYQAHLERLKDAEGLRVQRRWRGCIYLAGIAVECVLKYAHCKRQGKVYYTRQELWSRRGHDLAALLQQVGLSFRAEDKAVQGSFQRVAPWDINLRYQPDAVAQKEAERFLEAAKKVCAWVISRLEE